jgi:Flp pilus assembly pilin Flp
MHGQSARAEIQPEGIHFMDRFNVWVGSLFVRAQDINLKKDEGQTFVEYSLILVLVAVAVVSLAAFTGLAGEIKGAMDKVGLAI